MRTTIKFAAAAALAGALAVGTAGPSQARWHGHHWHGAGAAIGFGVGALVGAAAASASNGYYGPAYGPGPYAYEPGYAYQPAPAYRAYDYAPAKCWITTDKDRGYGYYGSCAQAPYAPGARLPRNEAR